MTSNDQRPATEALDLQTILEDAIKRGIRELTGRSAFQVQALPTDNTQIVGQDACVLSISGDNTGSLVMLGDPTTNGPLSDMIVHALLGEHFDATSSFQSSPQNSPSNDSPPPLSEIQESAIREMCNRVGTYCAANIPPKFTHELSFPVFFRGEEIKLAWDFDLQSACRINFECASVDYYFGIKTLPKQQESLQSKLQAIEALRQQALAKTGTD